MPFLKLSRDKRLRRLRWVMVGTVLFDHLSTILGQPASYWQNPETAQEMNRGAHYFLARGLSAYLLFTLITVGFLFCLVSVLPRTMGLIIAFMVILIRYRAASSWLCYQTDLGLNGPLIYGIILSVLVVLLVFPTNSEASREKALLGKSDT